MNRIWDKPIEELGTAEFSRWMLPNGLFLNVPDYWDHRQLGGVYGPHGYDGWREFLMYEGVTVHWDPKSRHLWIRTIGLKSEQRMAWQSLYEEISFRVDTMYVIEYAFEDLDHYETKEFEIMDEELCRLYITDTIDYRMEQSRQEAYEDHEE